MIHSSPAYWEYDRITPLLNFLYAGPANSQLFQYQLCADPHAVSPIDPTTCSTGPVGSTDVNGNPLKFTYGVTPAISAASASDSDAVVWAIKNDGTPESTTPGILYAFDALTMKELYGSDLCVADSIAPATKFSIPTVANGYVYIGAQELSGGTNNETGTFYIFGSPRKAGC